MPVISNHAPGSFCWFELATSDQAAAKQFYCSLFGWAARDTPLGSGETYTEFQLEGRDVGATPIFGPMTLEGAGTIAAIADPQGAVFAIIGGPGFRRAGGRGSSV